MGRVGIANGKRGGTPEWNSTNSSLKPPWSPCTVSIKDKRTDLSHGVPAPDCRGPVLQGLHRLLAHQHVVGPVRRPLEADILFLKHARSIFRQSSNPVYVVSP